MKRHPQVQKFIDNLAEKAFGEKPTLGKCVFCHKEINPETDFKDELSKKEYGISGICQEYQDETFG